MQDPESSIHHPDTRHLKPVFPIQHPESRIQNPVTRIAEEPNK